MCHSKVAATLIGFVFVAVRGNSPISDDGSITRICRTGLAEGILEYNWSALSSPKRPIRPFWVAVWPKKRGCAHTQAETGRGNAGLLTFVFI